MHSSLWTRIFLMLIIFIPEVYGKVKNPIKHCRNEHIHYRGEYRGCLLILEGKRTVQNDLTENQCDHYCQVALKKSISATDIIHGHYFSSY